MDYLIAAIIALLVFLLLRHLLLRPGSEKPVRYTARESSSADRRRDNRHDTGGSIEASRTDYSDSGGDGGGGD
ncbi:hypothetical protein [Aliamphritea spongicola]|uniref:hypothetical protein n=1 Tax=Aliamphritea spongicola TaxID=707589 RepID=UPI00196AC8FB|nr:hypothetical protein [Aliamphritea spongicola]MBN3561003.1 hypothetical protein [Aliamphritea spongicola]